MSSCPSVGFGQRLRRALAAVACAVWLAACGGSVDIMNAIPEDEANDILSALLEAGIPAEKIPGKEGAVGVRVEGSLVGRSLEVLREKGLPRERFAGMGQVFKKEGLISSPLEERARYIYALSQEISNTLSKIDGVLAARVHVVLPERGSSGEAGVPSTAAVFVKHQNGYNLDTIQPQIRRLVTNSIPGLTAERVSVIFVEAQPRAAVPSAAAGSVLGFPVAQESAAALGIVVWTLVIVALLSLTGLGLLAWRYVLPARRGAAAAGEATPAAPMRGAVGPA